MGNTKSSQSRVGALDANKSDNYDGWCVVEDQAGELNVSSVQTSYLECRSYSSTETNCRENSPIYPEEKPPPYTTVSASPLPKKCQLAEDDQFIPASESSTVEESSLDTCTLPDDISVDFIEHEKLGSGSYASVYLGDYKGKPCAVKKYHSSLLHHIETVKQKSYRASCFEDEVKILKGIHHPCIVKYFTHYEEWDNRYRLQLIVMERLHGNLDDWLAAGQKFNKQNTMSNIASALEYIHDRGIIHGDVNPTNILLSKNGANAKLADFGCAQYLGPSSRNCPGNPAFMPPQVSHNADKQEEVSHLSPKIDMFSFGLVLLIVHNGSFPLPDISGRTDGSGIIPEIERRAGLIKAVRQKMPAELFDFATRCIDSAPDARPDAKDYPNKSESEVSFGSESCSVDFSSQVKSIPTSVTPEELTTLDAMKKDTHLHASMPSLQLRTKLPNDPLHGKQQPPIKQQTKNRRFRIELTDHTSPKSEGQVEEKHTQLHTNHPPISLHTKQSDEQAPTLLDEKSQLQQTKEKKPTKELADDPPSENEVGEKDTQLRDNQPSLQLHNKLPDDPLLNGKQQLSIKQQTKETELRIELTDHPSPESEGQVEEKHSTNQPTVQLSTKQTDEQAPTLLDGKSQLQQTKEKKPTKELADDPPSENEVGEKDTQLRDNQPSLPDDPLLNGKQQLPIKQQTKETELRIELTDHPSPESEGQVEEKHSTNQPTVQLSTKQSDDQAPTLLDGKSQLQQTKEKKPTLEPRVDPPSESDVEEMDTQLRDNQPSLQLHTELLPSEREGQVAEKDTHLCPNQSIAELTEQAAETHQSTVTRESSGKSPPPKQPTKQTKVLGESDANKAKDIRTRKRKLSVSAKALHEQVEEDEALPFKRVKLTSESVHVTQWSVWPKCVSKQAAETHMQTVTGESSGKSPPPKQPTKQTKVLAESDALNIGPRKRKLSVSAQVISEDEGMPLSVELSICLAAPPCKRVKLTSDSVQWSLWPKGVTGQGAEAHVQTVTRESSAKLPPSTEPKKVLAESNAKDIGSRKTVPSAKANQKKQPDYVLKPKELAHGSSKALEPTVKKARPPTKLAAKQRNNRTARKPQQSVEQTQDTQVSTEQFPAVRKEVTSKPKSKTQTSNLTETSVTKVNTPTSTHPTVSRSSRRKNRKLRSQRKRKENDLLPPDTTASVDKQSLSRNSDTSCFGAHSPQLTTRKKAMKAMNRKSTDRSKALQNDEASSLLPETEQQDSSCGSKGTASMEKSCRERRNKRKKKRNKQLTKQPLEHHDENYGLKPEKSTDKHFSSHIKNSSSENGSPPIMCCNNSNGDKDSTTSTSDNGSSSQTGSNSPSQNTSSSSSTNNGASPSGCGGSGGRDDDDKENKDNHTSTDEESSDNEEASEDMGSQSHDVTESAHHQQVEVHGCMPSVYKPLPCAYFGKIRKRPKQRKKQHANNKFQQKQVITNTLIVKEAAKPSKDNHIPIPATKNQSGQQRKRKKPSTLYVCGGGGALDSNNSRREHLVVHEQPSGADGYESDTSEVKLKHCHKAVSPSTNFSPFKTEVKLDHSLKLSLNVATPSTSRSRRNSPHQGRPPEQPVPVEALQVCALYEEAREECVATGPSTASQLVRPPEVRNLTGKKSKIVPQHASQQDASCGSKATETLEKSCRVKPNKIRKKRKKQLTGQSLKQPEEDFDPEKSTSKKSLSRIKTPTNSNSSKNGSPPIMCCNNSDGDKDSTTSTSDNGSSSQTGSNSPSQNTASSNGNSTSANGCGGSGGKDDDEWNKNNHKIISSEESSTEEESSDDKEAMQKKVVSHHRKQVKERDGMTSVYKHFVSYYPGCVEERPMRNECQQQMQNPIVVKEAAKLSKGNHAPMPATITWSGLLRKRKKPSTLRGGGGVLDSNDSDASTHHGEQSLEVLSSKCSVNAVEEYKSDDSVKRKHCDDKATSSTLKTSILSQTSVGSCSGAETSVPVEPKPFDGVSSNPPHYIRPPEHSSSGDEPPQLEALEGSLSETESVGEERRLFSVPIQVVDQSLPQSSSAVVYHKSLKLATASQFVRQALKNASVEEERPLFNAAIQVVDQSSASDLVVYSHRMPPRCHEMNTAYMFHFIRPPSMDCDGPELFRALYGPDAENEPSPGAVVCVSDPSTGQGGPLMEATNCRPRQCFFDVHVRQGDGVVLCQDIGDFVALTDGAKELCQVIVDIIQFLRQKQLGLTTLESITIDVPRAISIPSSHLVPLNSPQTAITLGLLVRLVEEFLDLWERRYRCQGSGFVAINSLQLFVSWFHGESSGQVVETAALLGVALLKLRTH